MLEPRSATSVEYSSGITVVPTAATQVCMRFVSSGRDRGARYGILHAGAPRFCSEGGRPTAYLTRTTVFGGKTFYPTNTAPVYRHTPKNIATRD